MALRNQPYIPLMVDDFTSDEKLRECSAAANGVYIRIMCLMHTTPQYGVILLKQKHKQGKNICDCFASQLARQLPFTAEEISTCLDELIIEDVLQLDGEILSQKRMVKDNNISEKRAVAGSAGGKHTQANINFAKANTQAKGEANSVNGIGNENVIENKDLFNNFWSAYPKKKSKGDAEKAWKVIKPKKELVDLMIEKIQLLKKSKDWQKDGGQFVPFPATWLRAKGWEDEVIIQTEAQRMAEKHSGILNWIERKVVQNAEQ